MGHRLPVTYQSERGREKERGWKDKSYYTTPNPLISQGKFHLTSCHNKDNVIGCINETVYPHYLEYGLDRVLLEPLEILLQSEFSQVTRHILVFLIKVDNNEAGCL